MQNVYEQIDANKRKSAVLIILFILFIGAFGYFFAYQYGNDWTYLVYALGFSFFGSFSSFYFSDKIALSLSGAHESDSVKHSTFESITKTIAKSAGVQSPKTYIIPSQAMNAFATGRDPKHGAIAITQGLLDKLDRTELEGVIAHEISHIRNYDTRLMTIVAILVGTIAIVMDWSFRSGIGSSKKRSSGKAGSILAIIGVLLIILAPIIANLIKLAISRRREFFADAQATKITRQPSGLITALQKISSSKANLETASPATAHMYISNPLKNRKAGNFMAKMFSTHPPVQERIKALKGQL